MKKEVGFSLFLLLSFFLVKVHAISFNTSGAPQGPIESNGPGAELPVKGYNVVATLGTGLDFHSGAKMVYRDGYIYRAYSSTNQFGWPQFMVFDVRNPEKPEWVYIGRQWFTEAPGELAVYGNYAYVFTASSMVVVDISIASAPFVVQASTPLKFNDKATDVEIQGKYAYVGFDTAFASNSFRIIDLSNPLAPRSISGENTISTASYVNELAVYGKYVYLSIEKGAPNSFQVIDVSNPQVPVVTTITHPNAPSEIRDIVVKDGFIYGVSWFQSSVGLAVLDARDPYGIKMVANLSLPNQGLSIHLVGNYIFCGLDRLVHNDDTLRIVDISDPLKPKFVTTASIGIANEWRSITGAGNYVFLGGFLTNPSLAVLKLPGFNAPAAQIGQLNADILNVHQSVAVEKTIDVRGGLTIGTSGIHSAGPLAVDSGGIYLNAERLVGISTPTHKSVLRNSSLNGYVISTGTVNAWQWQKVLGGSLVGD